MAAANDGDAPAYGTDPLTARAQALFAEHFGPCATHFVFNGTAANVLALEAVLPRHGSVLCANTAHIHVDECGAPERVLGCKLQPVAAVQGKLCGEALRPHLIRPFDQHFAAPKVVSITQPTELGTLYSLDELAALGAFCRAHKLRLHIDGSRLTNAAAALGCSLRALCTDVGADVLSFGGTKAGLLASEAVVFLDPALAQDFLFRRKQLLQLNSKMRYIAAQFLAFLGDDGWRHAAQHANQIATQLAARLQRFAALRLVAPVQTNAVFVELPRSFVAPLRRAAFFYVWKDAQVPERCIIRLMAHFATSVQTVDSFVAAVDALCTGAGVPGQKRFSQRRAPGPAKARQ